MAARGGRGGGKAGVFRDRNRDPSELQTLDAPPPTFPYMENPAIPTPLDEMDAELVAYHTDFVEWMQNSPFYISQTISAARNNVDESIERYSDRYKAAPAIRQDLHTFVCDISRFPDELFGAKGQTRKLEIGNKEILERLDAAALQEGKNKKKNADGEEEEEQPVEEAEDYDDENEEEGNDYVTSYFDNGENDESDGDDGTLLGSDSLIL